MNNNFFIKEVRLAGFEPALEAWEAPVLTTRLQSLLPKNEVQIYKFIFS